MTDLKVGDRVVDWPDGRVFGTIRQIIEKPQSCFSIVIVDGDDGEEHRRPAWVWLKEESVPDDVLDRKKRKKEELNAIYGQASIGIDLASGPDATMRLQVDLQEAAGRQAIDCTPTE